MNRPVRRLILLATAIGLSATALPQAPSAEVSVDTWARCGSAHAAVRAECANGPAHRYPGPRVDLGFHPLLGHNLRVSSSLPTRQP